MPGPTIEALVGTSACVLDFIRGHGVGWHSVKRKLCQPQKSLAIFGSGQYNPPLAPLTDCPVVSCQCLTKNIGHLQILPKIGAQLVDEFVVLSNPLISNDRECAAECGALGDGLAEARHQWGEPVLWHGGDEFVEHAALAEQRVRAGL